MLDGTHKVHLHLLAAWRLLVTKSHVLEGLMLIQLLHFKVSGILPFGVPVLSIELQCVFAIARDLKTALASWRCVAGMQLGLIDQLNQLVTSMGKMSKLLPTLFIEQTIVTSMLGACDGVIFANDVEGLCSNFTVLPFQQDIAWRPFATWV